jgi:hypothetical protein
LFGDYQDAIKEYTEKLDVTERMFMRTITRGMQIFQRETNYIERYVQLLPDVNGNFNIPDDCILVNELRDDQQVKLLMQNYNQYARNVEKWDTGYLETPFDYTIRTTLTYDDNSITNFLRDCACMADIGNMRLFAIWGRRIYIYPYKAFPNMYLRYIPDIHAFSDNSPQWNTTDINGNPTGWAPANRFDTMFRTTVMSPGFAPYEQAFVNYAIAQYIMAKGSANYRVYQKDFWEEIERAKLNKPLYFTEGVSDYFMAPWS